VSGVFAVDEPAGPRWELALERFALGEPISLGRITFSRTGDAVEAAVASAWRAENLTDERARSDLEDARAAIEDLRAADEAFGNLLAGSSLDVVLVDDVLQVALCRVTPAGLEWLWRPES
jgi:hypothetical protein